MFSCGIHSLNHFGRDRERFGVLVVGGGKHRIAINIVIVVFIIHHKILLHQHFPAKPKIDRLWRVMTDSIARKFAASIAWMIVQRQKRTFKSPCKNCLDCVKGRIKYQLFASAKIVRKLEQKYGAIDG